MEMAYVVLQRYLFDHKYATKSRFTIETLGGVVSVEVDVGPDKTQSVQYVNVDMGEPKLLKSMIPMKGDPFIAAINESHVFGEEEYHLTCVSMGNPHAIMFVDDVNAVLLEKIGPIIEHDSLFPERINVGIVHMKGQSGD